MPTLQELKDKWFIDVTQKGQFPPQTRHPGTQVQPYTDGNLVEPVIDGAALTAEFLRRTETIINGPNPGRYELWIAQWKLEAVKLLGETSPAPDAENIILQAAKAGLKVYFLGSAHTGQSGKAKDFAKKLIAAGGQGAADRRIPIFGSQHQKFYVFRGPANSWLALLGSADLNYSRWDRPGHPADDPDRNPLSDGPSHDVSLRVQGLAVHDIALTFAERWNDPARRTYPKITTKHSTAFLDDPIPPAGPHSVQVLRTYGRDKHRGFSWAKEGEFTIWAAYLNAVKQANKYIYIEDQYFYALHNPPAFDAPAGNLRNSDLVYQLGEAIKRGVDVVVLLPSRKGSSNPTNVYQLYARRRAADYLRRIAETVAGAGRFTASYLIAGKIDPVVHAKVMLVDDAFALVGSANICQRSMSYDSEIHLGIIDAENQFTRDLRLALWQEHLDLADSNSLIDPTAAVTVFHKHAAEKAGRLGLLDTNPGRAAPFHNIVMNVVMDPYRGPKR